MCECVLVCVSEKLTKEFDALEFVNEKANIIVCAPLRWLPHDFGHEVDMTDRATRRATKDVQVMRLAHGEVFARFSAYCRCSSGNTIDQRLLAEAVSNRRPPREEREAEQGGEKE